MNIVKIPFYYPQINSNKPVRNAVSPEILSRNSSLVPVSNLNALTFGKQNYKLEQIFKVPYYDNGYIYRLNNGQKIVIIPKPGPIVIGTVAKVGGLNEPEHLSGISHFIEHCVHRGSKNFKTSDIDKQVEKIGGSTNAATDINTTKYFTTMADTQNIEKAMMIQADMIQHPSFLKKEVENEKKPVISEIDGYKNDIVSLVNTKIFFKLFNFKFPEHDIVIGTEKHVKSFEPSHLKDFHDKWYAPSNLTTFIVGDIKLNEAVSLVEKCFNKPSVKKDSDKLTREFKPTQKAHYECIKSPYLFSSMIALGFAGPENDNLEETIKVKALLEYLTGGKNSQFRKAIKEMHKTPEAEMITVGVGKKNPQVIYLASSLESGEETEGLSIIKKALDDIKKNPPKRKDINIIKEQMLDEINIEFETSNALLDYAVEAIIKHRNPDFISTKIESVIKSLKPKDIQLAAQKYLNLDKAVTIVGTPEGEYEEEEISNLSFKGNLKCNKVISFAGHLQNKNLGKIEETTLANNATFVTNSNKNLIRNSLSIVFATNSEKPVKPGVAELFEEMINKGNKKHDREAFVNILKQKSINMNINVFNDEINLNLTARKSKNFLQGTELALESIFNPDLSIENFDKTKSELELDFSDEPADAADRAEEELFSCKTTRRMAKENLENVTYSDVLEFYKNLTANPGTIIVASANFEQKPQLKEQLKLILENNIPDVTSYSSSPVSQTKPIDRNKILLESEDVSQAQIVRLFKVDNTNDAKTHASLEALSFVLGGDPSSRLFSDLRSKKGLAYVVESQYIEYPEEKFVKMEIITTTEKECDDGSLIVSPKNIIKSLKGFDKHVKSIIEKGITPQELETAKNQLKKAFIMEMETSLGKTLIIKDGYEDGYGKDYVKERMAAINGLTADDIQAAAQKYLTQPSVTSILAGYETVEAAHRLLKPFGEIKTFP